MKKQASSLSSKALLVQVNISAWSARRLDRAATSTVILNHSTSAEAGAYTKNLLPGAEELKTISALSSKIRRHFYEQTLPWMSDGSRIISAKNHLKFSGEIRAMVGEFNASVAEFVKAYPMLRASAASKLGGLYDVEEYPSIHEIESKFGVTVTYLPMPDVKDFRVELSDNEKREFEKRMRETESAALRDAWSRLHAVAKTAAEKLSDSKAVFRDSLLENVTEICALLPALNILDDDKLEASRLEVEQLVNKLSPDLLRDNASERDDAAKKLKDITARMGAYMGSV